MTRWFYQDSIERQIISVKLVSNYVQIAKCSNFVVFNIEIKVNLLTVQGIQKINYIHFHIIDTQNF